MSDKKSKATCQNLKIDKIWNLGLFKQLTTCLSEHARKSGGEVLSMNGMAVQYFRRSSILQKVQYFADYFVSFVPRFLQTRRISL